MRERSVKRKAEEWRKYRSDTTAGATSLVTQTARKYPKISTDAARKRKQRGPEGLTGCLSHLAFGARSMPALCSHPWCVQFWFPLLILAPEALQRPPERLPGFWPLPDFSLCPPCASSAAHG